MNAVQHTIYLHGGQDIGYAAHGLPRTRNVTFPSLKKYTLFLSNESLGVALCPLRAILPPSEISGKLVRQAPKSPL